MSDITLYIQERIFNKEANVNLGFYSMECNRRELSWYH